MRKPEGSSFAKCPECGGLAKIHETRACKDGSGMRRRFECRTCQHRWSVFAETFPRETGPIPIVALTVMDYIKQHPGCLVREIVGDGVPERRGELILRLAKSGHAVTRYDHSAGYCGRPAVRVWAIEHKAQADAWIEPPRPTYYPAPTPKPRPQATPYVGQIVPARPTPPRSEPVVEWREYGGQLVKVTIGPTVKDDPVPVLPCVLRVRVNLSSKWADL